MNHLTRKVTRHPNESTLIQYQTIIMNQKRVKYHIQKMNQKETTVSSEQNESLGAIVSTAFNDSKF